MKTLFLLASLTACLPQSSPPPAQPAQPAQNAPFKPDYCAQNAHALKASWCDSPAPEGQEGYWAKSARDDFNLKLKTCPDRNKLEYAEKCIVTLEENAKRSAEYYAPKAGPAVSKKPKKK